RRERIHGKLCHGISGHNDAGPGLQAAFDARDTDGQVPIDSRLTKDGPRGGDLRYLRGPHGRKPSWRSWEALNQVRIAKAYDDRGLAKGKNLVHERRCVAGQTYRAFAIGDFDE